MRTIRLAFLGFGNVGKALASLLIAKKMIIRQVYQVEFAVTGIATARHGIAINLEGIDLEQALASSDLSILSSQPTPKDYFDFIRSSQAEALFENSPVNYDTGEPAVSYLREALSMGMHAITANKGPVVHAYRDLTDLAHRQNRRFLFESTVMDGAPIFSLFREALPATNLIALRGVLNSTTNVILTRMEEGNSFQDAVLFCQRIGIAESDPAGDIDGWDAAVKVAALVTVLMGIELKPKDVARQGIRHITPRMVADAKEEGKRWKLICSARRSGEEGVDARVAPELVAADSPFFGARGTSSIVQFETDVLGLLSIQENDPGTHTTAYGLLADLLNAIENQREIALPGSTS